MFEPAAPARTGTQPGLFLSLIVHTFVLVFLWQTPGVHRSKRLWDEVIDVAPNEPLWLPVVPASRPRVDSDAAKKDSRTSVPSQVRVLSNVEQPTVASTEVAGDIEASLNLVQAMDLSADLMQARVGSVPHLEGESADPPPPLPPPPSEPKTSDYAPPAASGVPLVEPAQVIKKVVPVYPTLARKTRVEGVVVIDATIEESGKLDHLTVVEGHPLLIDAALDAVRQWRYTPAKLHGVSTSSTVRIRVGFRLVFSNP